MQCFVELQAGSFAGLRPRVLEQIAVALVEWCSLDPPETMRVLSVRTDIR